MMAVPISGTMLTPDQPQEKEPVMTEKRQPLHSGGCQCGAVRYALYAEPYGPHICHCRMCQKAFGSFFAALAVVDLHDFAWTRGAPSVFLSSAQVERGFCSACGTPLTFRDLETERIDLSIGSLDAPARVRPERQIGVESRVPWFAELAALPEARTDEAVAPERLAGLESRQHPDRDTETWPPRS
jgi:hypothetical protein